MKPTTIVYGSANHLRVIFFAMLFVLSACSEQTSDSPQPNELPSSTRPDSANGNMPDLSPDTVKDDRHSQKDNPHLRAFMDEVDQYYANLHAETEALYQQVLTFAKAPSEPALENSIKAWEQAHNRFLAGRFLNQLFKQLLNTETLDQPGPDIEVRLDAYPLLPGYLDSVSGYPFSGLIHGDIPITLANMYQEFQLGDPAYVTLGFHALEVMLKGTDQERQVSEFAKLKTVQEKTDADPELRRTLYCHLLAEQIRQDILQLPAKWRQNIKELLINLDETQSRSLKSRLSKILNDLGESASGRASPDTQSQADEHFNEHVISMQQDLQNRIRLSLEGETPQ